MAVESLISEKSYKPGAAMAPEPLTGIKFFDADDLVVELQLDGTARDEAMTLTRGADYVIGGNGEAAAGTITATAAYAADDLFHVRRNTSLLQKANFPAHQPVPSADLQRALDRLALVDADQMRELDRALVAPPGDEGGALPAGRAGSFLAFDALKRPIASSGTGADAGLRQDLAEVDGGDLIRFRGRTVRAKLDDWCTPLDFGASGDGLTLDTAPIDAAMATGKHVLFPKGYRFLTDTALGHAYAADRQIVELNGEIVHDGTAHLFAYPYHGFFALLSAFEREGIQLVGGGTLNGAWDGDPTSYIAGRVGSGLLLSNCPQPYVDGPQFEFFVEDGCKSYSCAEISWKRPTRCYRIRNIGLELRAYADNPLVILGDSAGFLGEEWTKPAPGPSGSIDGVFEWIDDGLAGAGNGTGVDFSGHAGAKPPNNLRISGNFIDCLLGIWSENNAPAENAFSIDLVSVLIRGNLRGLDADPTLSSECSDGVGLIGVDGGRISGLHIINQTNIPPPVVGSETVGLNIIQSRNIEIDGLRVTTDTAIADRMQHAIKLSGSHDVMIRSGAQDGVRDVPILYDGQVGAECTNVRVDGFDGAEGDHTWPSSLVPFKFSLANVPANAASNLLTVGALNFDKEVMPCAGRLVGLSARVSAVPTGSFTIAATISGDAQPLVTLDQDDFPDEAVAAASNAAAKDAEQSLAAGTLELVINTDPAWTNTHDVEVTAWYDPSWKR